MFLRIVASALVFGVVGCSSANATAPEDGGVASGHASDAGSHPDATVGAKDAGGVAPVADASSTGDAAQSDAGGANALAAYAVGVQTRTWEDANRPTPANGSEPARGTRTLVSEIWYPTPGAPTASPTRDAPLAPGGPYPLVLFVHGSGSNRTVYSYLTSGLARAGYVVVAADFPLTVMNAPGGSSDLHVSDQVGDLSFMCDQMKAAALAPSDKLRGAVDGLSYAVVGHSTGGTVAQLAAFGGDDALITHDSRVKAVVPLSGDACMFNDAFFAKRSVPILVVNATNDLFVPPENNGLRAFVNTNDPHMLATLIGGSHVNFTDFGIPDWLLSPKPTAPTSPLATTLSTYGDGAACLPVPAASTLAAMPVDTQHALTVHVVGAYLDAQMRHRTGPLTAVTTSGDPAVVFRP